MIPTFMLVASSVAPYNNLTLAGETINKYLAPDSVLKLIGAGVFTGREEYVEYTVSGPAPWLPTFHTGSGWHHAATTPPRPAPPHHPAPPRRARRST
jgi:hypothetical protein